MPSLRCRCVRAMRGVLRWQTCCGSVVPTSRLDVDVSGARYPQALAGRMAKPNATKHVQGERIRAATALLIEGTPLFGDQKYRKVLGPLSGVPYRGGRKLAARKARAAKKAPAKPAKTPAAKAKKAPAKTPAAKAKKAPKPTAPKLRGKKPGKPQGFRQEAPMAGAVSRKLTPLGSRLALGNRPAASKVLSFAPKPSLSFASSSIHQRAPAPAARKFSLVPPQKDAHAASGKKAAGKPEGAGK